MSEPGDCGGLSRAGGFQVIFSSHCQADSFLPSFLYFASYPVVALRVGIGTAQVWAFPWSAPTFLPPAFSLMSNGWDQAPVGDSAYSSSDREPRSLWQPLRDTIRANSQFQQGLLTHRVQGDVIPPRPNVQQNAATFPALALQQAWDENQAQAHAQAHESNLPSGSAGPGQWPQQQYAPNQGYQYPPASQWPGQEIPRPSYSPRPTVSSPWTGQGVGFAGGGAQPSHLLRTWRGKALMVTLKNGHEIIGVLNYISEDKGTEIFHLTQGMRMFPGKTECDCAPEADFCSTGALAAGYR